MTLKKMTLLIKTRAKVPVTVGKETVMVEQDVEIPVNIICDENRKQIGFMTSEELEKYEAKRGKLEALKAELEEKQEENSQRLEKLQEEIKKKEDGKEDG